MTDNQKSNLIKESLSWEKITTHYNIKYKEGKNSLCPFHDDKTSSLSFNKKEPNFNCFGCEAKGDFFHFIALKENLDCKQDFPEILQKAEQIAGTNYLEKKNSLPKNSFPESKCLDSNIIQKNCTQLEGNKQVLDWFKNERGIELETLKKAQIGYGSHPQIKGKAVIHFPYQNKKGQFIHNRIREIGNGKNVMSEKGSKANIFLAQNLNKIRRVFITEGEIDALSLLQHTNDVIGISGANGFQEAFMEEFRNIEEIILCGDNDEAGKSFNKKIISLFLQKYPYIQTYYIDWHGFPEKYDINDFYLSLSTNEREGLLSRLDNLRIKRTRREITPPQFFSKDFACTTVWEQKISDKGLLRPSPFLITSERKKLSLDAKELLSHDILFKTKPEPITEWSPESYQKFLKGNNLSSFDEVFISIKKELEKYILFEDARFYSLVSLWIMGTYFHRGMASYPYLSLQGNKACGKTKLLTFISILSFQGLLNVGSTAASITRLVHSNHATCCVDEAENLKNTRDENVMGILAIYNSGYKAGAKAMKCGKHNVIEMFESYSPKAFGGINRLNDTLASRCIEIIMPPVKNRRKFNEEIHHQNPELKTIKDNLHTLMIGQFRKLFSIYEEIKTPNEKLSGRDWELWKPILSIAKLLDANTFQTMKELSISLTKKRNSSDFSSEDDIEFLEIILEQTQKYEDGYCPIKELKNALLNADSETFNEIIDENKNTRWIGDWLKRLNLLEKKGVQRKIFGINTRCYRLNTDKIQKRIEALQ